MARILPIHYRRVRYYLAHISGSISDAYILKR